MTPMERNMLQDFLSKLTSVRNITKDPEADMMIKQALSTQPDAGYILVQNILLMQHSITELNARVAELETKQTNVPQASFLGNQNQNAVKSYFGAQSQNYQPQPQPQQQYPNQAAQGSGFGDFLRSAGTTAAGVAGGMFLFEGVSHLFGSSSGGSFMGSGAPINETVVNNNYYQDTSTNDSFLDSNDVDGAFDSGGFDSGGDDLF